MTSSRLLTTSDVATMLSTTPAEIRRWIRTGQLRGRQIDGRWRVEFHALARFSAGGISTLTRDAIPEVKADIDAKMIKLTAAYDASDYESLESAVATVSGLVRTLREAESLETCEGLQQMRVWTDVTRLSPNA